MRCNWDETILHLFVCPSAAAWKKDLETTTRALLNRMNTAADLKEHIMDKMMQWLTQKQVGCTTCAGYYDWIQITGGLIPAYWTMTQYEFQEQQTFYPEKGGTKWAQKISRHFMTKAQEIWKECNKIQHQNTEETTSRAHDAASAKIRHLCAERYKLLQQDREMFEMDVEEFIHTSRTSTLDNWLRVATDTFQEGVK